MISPGKQINVAVLIYPMVEMIDMVCPMDTFNKVNYFTTVNGNENRYNIYTVSESTAPIDSQEGLVHLVPGYSFQNCPPPDIIIVPGISQGPDHDRDYGIPSQIVLDWITQMNQEQKQILSVCIGAFILEAAGLLNGKMATTHYMALGDLAANKTITVIGNVRFVDTSDNIVTAAGLTSGIAGALHIIEKYDGSVAAQQAADILMYNMDAPLPPDTLTSLFYK